MDFYTVLGISREADMETIRHAHRMLVRRYHPDQGSGASAERFRQVREAYETLIDPARRRLYDFSLQQSDRPVRVQQWVAPLWPFPQENPDIFGKFAPGMEPLTFRNSANFSDVFASWLMVMEELSYEEEWPWW